MNSTSGWMRIALYPGSDWRFRCSWSSRRILFVFAERLRLVKKDPKVEAIAHYLGNVASEHTGLGINRSRDLEIAEILIDWKETLLSN